MVDPSDTLESMDTANPEPMNGMIPVIPAIPIFVILMLSRLLFVTIVNVALIIEISLIFLYFWFSVKKCHVKDTSGPHQHKFDAANNDSIP